MMLSERIPHDSQCVSGYDKAVACDCFQEDIVVEVAQLEADRERDAQIVSNYSKERGRLIKKIARWRKALEKIQKDAADPWCINIARETLEGDDDGGS